MADRRCTIHGKPGRKPHACAECEFIVTQFKRGDSVVKIAVVTGYSDSMIESILRQWMKQGLDLKE